MWNPDKDKKIHIMCSFPETRYQGIWDEWKYLEHLFLCHIHNDVWVNDADAGNNLLIFSWVSCKNDLSFLRFRQILCWFSRESRDYVQLLTFSRNICNQKSGLQPSIGDPQSIERANFQAIVLWSTNDFYRSSIEFQKNYCLYLHNL